LGPSSDIRLIAVEDTFYRYSLPRFDQTSTPVTESAIEFIVRKRSEGEVSQGGRLPEKSQPTPNLRTYFNQYGIDYKIMKAGNQTAPPFSDESEL
jgi:hypothetical protein